MDNVVQNFKKNILKNFIYFMISFVLLIFFLVSINFERLSKTYDILDEISFINGHIKENKPDKIPYDYNFIQNNHYIQSQNNGLSKSFETKINNFLANVYALGGNLEKAKEKISDDDWLYYFNKGNIEFFDSYQKYGTGNLENFETYKTLYSQLGQSISDYNSSAMILGTGDSNSPKIINNRNVAYEFRFLVGAEGCVNGYITYIKKFDNIISQIESLVSQFEKQISDLNDFQRNLKNNDLQDCLKKINKGLNESKINLQNLGVYIIDYKKQSVKQMSGMVLSPDQCIAKLDNDRQKILSATKQIDDGLQSFEQITSQMSDILQKKDENALSQICNGSGNQNNQDFNNSINDGLSQLDDTLGDQSQQPKDGKDDQNKENQQPQNGQGQPNQQNDEEQKKQNSNTTEYKDIPQGYEKNLMQQLDKNSKSWINEMNKLRGDQYYNVQNYINQLFQDFYGHDKDFTNQQNGTGMQYNNGY